MPLLPYAKLVIESPLAPAGAVAALAEHVEPRRMLRWPGGAHVDFEGEVGESVFTIRRIMSYQNSFRPEVRGAIEAGPGGSRIALTMRLHGFVIAFCLVWTAIVGTGAILSVGMLLRAGVFTPLALVPLGMLAFFGAMTAGGFTYEATRARRLLAEILRGREIP